jgi:hypothetical protein
MLTKANLSRGDSVARIKQYGSKSYGFGHSLGDAWREFKKRNPRPELDALPFVESSSEPLLVWGAEETDEIWLLSDNGRVQHLRIRFDMRRPNMPMFDHVVSAAEDLRLAILEVGRRRIVPRDVNVLVQAAAASRAAGVAAGLGASMDLTPQSEATWLQGLTPADRVRFLVRLAHNLTITARVRSLPKNFEQLRNLNEIQHRILGYVCHAIGPDEDPAWLPIVAGYVLEPNDQGLRTALRRDWHEAREQYRGRGP